VEETVFETLTQQYEIAKVQEAKEVPSVKVLDPPEIPEKKAFPPRILFACLGGVLAMVIGAGWVVVSDGWERIDPQDPGKLLVLHMARSVRPQLEYVVQQGTSFSARAKRIFARSQEESEMELKQETIKHRAADQEQYPREANSQVAE